MINLESEFSPRVNPADADYPFGSIKDNTSPGANDGTPLAAVWGNDWEGFAQAAMTEAGITPSGLPDTAQDSQLLDAVKAVASKSLRIKVVILATGQSNVQQEPAYAWTPPSNVFVWAWPGLNTTGNKFIACPAGKINHTYASAAELARLNPLWDVYVIRIGSGGRPIDHWLPGGSSTTLPDWNAYEDCKNNTEAALSSLGLSKIDYFQWHQGESDITNVGPYKAKWDQVFDRFCGESWFKKNTRILVNGITSTAIKGYSNYSAINQKLRSIVRDSPSLRTLVPTAEIVPLDLWLADGLHMSGEGHHFLGVAEAQTLQFGGALPLPQGYMYDPEKRNICLGGASPAAGGTVEINKGSLPSGLSHNSRTSLDVINTQTDTGDLASSRVIGANGAYSVTAYAQGALANTVRMEWTGTSQMQFAITTNGAFVHYCGSVEVFRAQNALWRPGTDATVFIGNASYRLKTIYLETAPIVTSDERMKSPPLPMTDEVLDAWATVDYFTYKMLASIAREGEDARIHAGVIAQRIIEAFAAKGLDAHRYGLLCHDVWEAIPAEYQVCPAEYDKGGNLLTEERMILVSPARAAGDRYSVRYDEAWVYEAALQRRNYQRLLSRIEALESN